MMSGPGESGSDPRFGSCADANAAGYGPYRRGEPEYSWYVDTDRDGIACE
jgi:micrococcal nuclease